MDFRELMRIAAENKQRAQKECKETKRYTTKLPPPKKELKTVDPNAIKNRLKTKEELIREKAAEEARKKEELLRLRAELHPKKIKSKKGFKSSFTATKDAKSYQPDRTQYDDNEHKDRHKNFMKKVDKVAKKNIDDWFDSNSSSSEEEEVEEVVEPVPVKKKPASANNIKGPISFEEIMRIAAEKRKPGNQSGATATPAPSKESQNGGGNGAVRTTKFMSSFNKNHRDRNEKPPVIGNGRLNLKAAAEKYKAKNVKVESQKPDGLDETEDYDDVGETVIGNGRLHKPTEKHLSKSTRVESTSGSRKQSHERSAIKSSDISNKTKGERSRSHKMSSERTMGEPSRCNKPSQSSKSSSDSKTKPIQSRITEHMKVKGKDVRKDVTSSRSESKSSMREDTLPKKQGKSMVNGRDRPAENGKSKTMLNGRGKPVEKDWSKIMANDRDRQMSSKEKARPSPVSNHRERQQSDRPRTAEELRRSALKRSAPPLPRMKAKHGRLMSDDESDYEDDGFIDDSPMEEQGQDVSSYIKEIFGYDKTKFKPESDYALRFMDASYKDIQKEEARSARLGMLEDLEELKKEKEEERRQKMKKMANKKKGGKR